MVARIGCATIFYLIKLSEMHISNRHITKNSYRANSVKYENHNKPSDFFVMSSKKHSYVFGKSSLCFSKNITMILNPYLLHK